jgi:hypothetical protein
MHSEPRIHLLVATILLVNLVGAGTIVTRVAHQRPVIVSPASVRAGSGTGGGDLADEVSVPTAPGAPVRSDLSAAFAPPDEAPGDIPVAPDSGSGSGRPDSYVPGAARGDGTVFSKYDVAEDGAKVFKLDAAPYTWMVGPGVKKQAFAYNGTVPGPTIRVIEGDKVRIIVTNRLPRRARPCTGTGWSCPTRWTGCPASPRTRSRPVAA